MSGNHTTPSSITEVATGLGLDQSIVTAATITAQRYAQFAFSGWLASGKDCVADSVYEALDLPSEKLSLALPLKEELTQIMRVAGAAPTHSAAVDEVAISMEVSATESARVLSLLVGTDRSFEDARTDLDESWTGWTRTHQVRLALQFWGTDVRRSQNTRYWVDRALVLALTRLADGVVPYFCDCRFPDEVTGLQSIGYKVVRLEVSRDVQRQRLLDRDGILPDPAALSHSSEVALDDFVGFDIVINNDGTLEEATEAVLDTLR